MSHSLIYVFGKEISDVDICNSVEECDWLRKFKTVEQGLLELKQYTDYNYFNELEVDAEKGTITIDSDFKRVYYEKLYDKWLDVTVGIYNGETLADKEEDIQDFVNPYGGQKAVVEDYWGNITVMPLDKYLSTLEPGIYSPVAIYDYHY